MLELLTTVIESGGDIEFKGAGDTVRICVYNCAGDKKHDAVYDVPLDDADYATVSRAIAGRL